MPDERLLQLFNEDLSSAEQLAELLETEHEALRTRALSDLEHILQAKQPILAILAQHGTERSRVLIQAGLTGDQAGLTRLAERSAIGAQLLQSASALAEKLEHCQALNRRNGRLIHSNQASTSKMLHILRGGESETPGLYNAHGSSVRGGYQRPLSQA